jgi:hypothetical protein
MPMPQTIIKPIIWEVCPFQLIPFTRKYTYQVSQHCFPPFRHICPEVGGRARCSLRVTCACVR